MSLKTKNSIYKPSIVDILRLLPIFKNPERDPYEEITMHLHKEIIEEPMHYIVK